MSVTLQDIQAAADRIAAYVYDTPCPASAALSQVTGCDVFCKLDYLQRTGSFKERGACNALLMLDDSARKRGVVAASAGNHALGLAQHGKTLGIPVTVVMPRFAPLTKVTNCRSLGAEVILHGDDFGRALEHVRELERTRGLTFVSGFDNPDIVAGAGTLGLEVLRQVPQVQAIVVPIGGAGLIAGVSLAIKSTRPDVAVIGVEPRNAASFTAALDAGRPVRVAPSPTIADGLAVPQVGQLPFDIARKLVDRVVTVDEHWLSLAVLRLIELEKAVVEGAGAAPLAALMAGLLPELRGKRVVLPLCGGNIDTTMLGRIIERGLAADGRLCRFDAAISDRPGGLARLAAVIADEGASIKDVAHDRAFAPDDLASVLVRCVVETRDREHARALADRLRREGFAVRFHGDGPFGDGA